MKISAFIKSVRVPTLNFYWRLLIYIIYLGDDFIHFIFFKNNQTIQFVKSAVAFDCSGVQPECIFTCEQEIINCVYSHAFEVDYKRLSGCILLVAWAIMLYYREPNNCLIKRLH